MKTVKNKKFKILRKKMSIQCYNVHLVLFKDGRDLHSRELRFKASTIFRSARREWPPDTIISPLYKTQACEYLDK